MSLVCKLAAPTLLLAPRHIKLYARSAWELWLHLRSSGWAAEVCLSTSRRPPAYVQGGEKIIYVKATWKALPRMYLLALASSQAVFSSGVHSAIEHWSTSQYYVSIVAGKPLPQSRKRAKQVQ
eukprot:14853163-Alexandrium_andersonii.AAC.1